MHMHDFLSCIKIWIKGKKCMHAAYMSCNPCILEPRVLHSLVYSCHLPATCMYTNMWHTGTRCCMLTCGRAKRKRHNAEQDHQLYLGHRFSVFLRSREIVLAFSQKLVFLYLAPQCSLLLFSWCAAISLVILEKLPPCLFSRRKYWITHRRRIVVCGMAIY